MNVTIPKYTNERNAITAASNTNGPHASWSSPFWTRPATTSVRKPRSRGSSWTRAAAISHVGISTNTVPCMPNTTSSGVISTGPSANPMLPPTLNRLIPLERRAPET